MNPPNTFNIEVLCIKRVVFFNKNQKYSVMIKKRFEADVPKGSFSVINLNNSSGFRLDSIEEFLEHFTLL